MEAQRGQVNMDRLLSRKPLHDLERRAEPCKFCVTGEPIAAAAPHTTATPASAG